MPDELADLLAEGERAAFHGRPAAGVSPLQRAVELAGSQDRSDEAIAAGWLLGVVLAAAGRYGSALRVLEPLALAAAPATASQRLFAALAGSTAASVHRQLGRHEAARQLDRRARDLAGDEPGLAEAAFDAELGLAADAVGLGDEPAARRHLAVAAALAEPRSDWWRQRVRLGWVRAEVALLAGDPPAALAALEPAVALAERANAPRHVAKSLLFLGAARASADQVPAAVAALRRSSTLAESLGAVPLVWTSRALLGALLDPGDPEAARSLAAARSAALSVAEDLPDDLRAGWLGRDDVAALLGTA